MHVLESLEALRFEKACSLQPIFDERILIIDHKVIDTAYSEDTDCQKLYQSRLVSS